MYVLLYNGRPLYAYRKQTVVIYACFFSPTNFCRRLSTDIHVCNWSMGAALM